MATNLIEPCGDADFGIGLWPSSSGTPTIVTDFVHGGHIKSVRFRPSAYNVLLASNLIADAGGRVSIYFNIQAYPTGNSSLFILEQSGDGNAVVDVSITSAGLLKLVGTGTIANGSTLSLNTWYRLSFAWTITSSTVNQFRLWKNGVLDITAANATLPNVTSADLNIGNAAVDATYDVRINDFYLDDSTALTDPGNIWVTAKRPNANGTTNGFTTQIGSGGSGYGTGHSPQVNERPNNDTNGWSIVTVASAITEEYNIESKVQGDIDITRSTIVDYMGWVRSKALTSETAQIIVNGASSNISLTSTIAFFKKIAGSTTYPAGTGADIGEISAAIATTISLYECGIVVAYIPLPPPGASLPMMGIG